MKKVVAVLAVALTTVSAAHAQFGIVGGFTSSNTKLDINNVHANFKAVSLYHAGVAYKVPIGSFFVIQPELTYEMKGGNLSESSSFGLLTESLQTKTGYLELGLGLQGGVDLIAFRPFVLVQPFVGYAVYAGKETGAVSGIPVDDFSKTLLDAKNKMEYGIGLGGGIELMKHVQISVQWFTNFGKLYNGDKIRAAYTDLSDLKDVRNYSGLKVTLGLFF